MIYQEFFSQGDMEKELGKAPIAMMDRDSACIPELQIGFLDGIALPVFKLVYYFVFIDLPKKCLTISAIFDESRFMEYIIFRDASNYKYFVMSKILNEVTVPCNIIK